MYHLKLFKDLEADSAMRVTLALNYLIQCPSEDVIPAVQTRLRGLLSHKSCAILFSPAVSGYNHAFKTAYTQTGPSYCSRSSRLRPRGPGGIVI
jgi:hypothetical protein